MPATMAAAMARRRQHQHSRLRRCRLAPWHFLNFLPLPHAEIVASSLGHGAILPSQRWSVRCALRRADRVDPGVPGRARPPRAAPTLDIYLIDVEGGNATLFVTPSGESLLIDTGNGGAAAARDAGRILAAAKDAGVTQLDHLVTTHYHGDHFGAMAIVASKLPVKHFIDHGANVQPNPATDAFLQKAYPAAVREGEAHRGQAGRPDRPRRARRRASSRRPGSAHGVAARRRTAQPVLRGLQAAGRPIPRENAQSVGQHFTFGRFRAVHLGDLTWNKEFDLMCPTNRLGTVDLFIVSHHGQAISNAPVLVHALRPRVAHDEQRHAQGRAARRDEGAARVAGPRGSVADALLAAERPGIHRARHVHRQRRRRAAGGDADRAAASPPGPGAAPPRRQARPTG